MRWLATSAVASTWESWRRSWIDLPAAARREFWVQLGWSLLIVQILALALLFSATWLDRNGYLTFEGDLLRALEQGLPFSFNTAIWLDVFGNGLILLAIITFAAAHATRRSRPLIAITLILGYGSLFFPVLSGWLLWSRQRPTVIAEGLGSPGESLSSFPSGHLVQAIVAFGLLAYIWLRETRSRTEKVAVAMLFLAVVVAVLLARLRLGAHWPSDMAAGAVIGFVWLGLVIRVLRRAERAVLG